MPVWFDIGAYHGDEMTNAPRSTGVYLFEPCPEAADRIPRHPNFNIIRAAVSEANGVARLNLAKAEQAHSLLSFAPGASDYWFQGCDHVSADSIIVPTVRLDTVMDCLGINEVEYMKIDAQGMDLAVLRSAGLYIRCFAKIKVEAPTRDDMPLYAGGHTRREIQDFLESHGFALTSESKQAETAQGHLEVNMVFERRGI